MLRRKCKVHALPTEKANEYFKKGQLMLVPSNIIANKGEWQICGRDDKFSNNNSCFTAHHLYFTSDEQIKQGDWYTVTSTAQTKASHLRKCKEIKDKYIVDEETNSSVYKHCCEKVVATTNPELWKQFVPDYSGWGESYWTDGVDRIAKDFVEAFVDEQGIWEVALDSFSIKEHDKEGEFVGWKTIYKTNSSHAVVVHRVKEKRYSRKEVLEILQNYESQNWVNKKLVKEWNKKVREWFNKHYPNHH